MKPSESVVSIPEPEDGRGGWSIILCLFLVLFAICAVALFSMLCEGKPFVTFETIKKHNQGTRPI